MVLVNLRNIQPLSALVPGLAKGWNVSVVVLMAEQHKYGTGIFSHRNPFMPIICMTAL